jgi:2-hydroxychromene-2-carboxylate isomerase
VKRRPTAFFSFRSPYSWLAFERLERVAPERLEQLELIPFWDPDTDMLRALAARGGSMHYMPMSKAKHLYLLQDTKRLARRLELDMAWPIDVQPWWEIPHLAWLAARHQGCERALYRAVVNARWKRGTDVCRPEIMAEIASGVGLDPELIANAARDPAIRAEALECLLQASENDVFGIPYFKLGPKRFWGFDRLDDFLAALVARDDSASEPAARAPAPPMPSEAYDRDTTGGCG